MINKTVEIKFDVNWIKASDNDKLNKILQKSIYELEKNLERDCFAIVNLKCKSKEY